MFVVLQQWLGESSKRFDDWKGSFAFPILMHTAKPESSDFYMGNLYDHRGYLDLSLYRITSAVVQKEKAMVLHKPFASEFSQEELSHFMRELYEQIKDTFDSQPRLPAEPLPVVPPSPPVRLIASPPKVASGETSALLWKDFPSSRLRREWSNRLRTQRIELEVEILPAKPKSAPVLLDRHRRAHRRLSWAQCLKRNQSLGTQTHWSVQLHGVPSGIIAYLKVLEERVSASAA